MWKIISLSIILILCNFVNGVPKVPCHFIFGDSLFDAGNNNDLITKAKANYSPYGVDFPGRVPTGRFTNGLTTSDVITQYLGMEGLIPPFSSASGIQILKGVNYASGSAGLHPESGSHLGDRIWLARQVEYHGKTITELESYIQGPASDYLNKCLYTVNIGSNDFINNYFMPQFYNSKNVSTPDQFATTMIAQYDAQLKTLYGKGARKTAIFGLGLIGCIPAVIKMNKATLCVDEVNDAVQIYNKKLRSLVESLNKNLNGAKFTFIDIATMQITFPTTFLSIIMGPCCELRSDYQCDPSKPPCRWRDLYSFMDGFHPTQFVNKFAAKIAFDSPNHWLTHPVNINTLVSSGAMTL